MASTEYTSSCILLLILATFAHCELGQTQSTHVHNSASNDITHGKYLTQNDGTVTIIHQKTIAKGTTEVFEVPEEVQCVRTSYLQLPAKSRGQVVLDWCTKGMPVDCLPNCYWIIDDTGFSVANSESTTLHHVADWETVHM